LTFSISLGKIAQLGRIYQSMYLTEQNFIAENPDAGACGRFVCLI
jgi:hypothetical protein